ncbi:SUMF1/EgtB/PvdO family nonheme iron enzyme [Candidatus Omnitrophota bacterium]
MLKRATVWCIALTVLLATTAFATITGTVTDTSGDPVSGVQVTFTDETNTDNTYSAYTDGDGRYELTLAPVFVVEEPPQRFILRQNYPNPFNPSTTIPYTIAEAGHVSLTVYNALGQRVRTLVNEYRAVGAHTATWDGRDDDGASAAAGIYIYQLRSGGQVESRKMLLLDGGGAISGSKEFHSYNTAAKQTLPAEASYYTVTALKDGYHDYSKENVDINNISTFDITLTPYETNIYNGITFVTIPGGTFRMGDIQNYNQYDYEKPVHDVTISGFEMSIYEITQGQYRAVIGSNPSHFSGSDDLPVEQVSWYDAVKFCNRLSEQMGYEKCYDESSWACDFSKNGFRLPTEAEWEYACRAGTETYFYSGNNLSSNGRTSTDLDKAGWYDGNSGNKNHPVGQKEPNAFGLYDMHGNMWEWCNDWWIRVYTSDSVTNPVEPLSGSYPVLRGGSWGNYAMYCRSAFRNRGTPTDTDIYIGFRVVRSPNGMTPGGNSDKPHDITFVSIPGDTFQMGDVENAGHSNEHPVHAVTLSSFDMSTTEITNAHYAVYLNEALASEKIEIRSGDVYDVTGDWSGERYLDIGYEYDSNNKCWIQYSNGAFTVTAGKENWPVVAVTWYGSKAFALFYGHDLPTEAEWEYACRGGKQYMYGTDDGTIDSSKANYNGNVGHTTDVGNYPANPFGLYDMSGNIWEWCHDWDCNWYVYYHGSVTNPSGALSGSNRDLRGGGWGNSADACRSAFRGSINPDLSHYRLGFRVVRRPGGVTY